MQYLELLNTYIKNGYLYEYWLIEKNGKIKTKLVMQHRRIVEKDTKIPEGYHVHHINGIKTDNSRMNLLVLPASLHAKLFHNIKDKLKE